MRKRFFLPILLSIAATVLVSCVPKETQDNDYMVNFKALWSVINERYCFLEEKGVDWDAVYKVYEPLVRNNTTNDVQFFKLMSSMLDQLKDGHVNLISTFDVSHNNDWLGDETEGLNIYARRKVLGDNLMTSGGMKYNLYSTTSRPDLKIGYISYGSFTGSVGNTDFIFEYFKDCAAIILDVRGNGGGSVENSQKLVSLFIKEKTLVGYTSHKLGPGRNNFSNPKALYVSPSNGKQWTEKPVVILQDRGCYSATNDFLFKVSAAPNVVRIGLRSGGGGGLPSSSELPNGWRIRYSAVKSFDKDMKDVEGGIDPDIHITGVAYDKNPQAPDMILLGAIKYILDHNPTPKEVVNNKL